MEKKHPKHSIVISPFHVFSRFVAPPFFIKRIDAKPADKRQQEYIPCEATVARVQHGLVFFLQCMPWEKPYPWGWEVF